eukprot:scaffold246844_cov26-Tisochrysis_lutea.AAC.2
MRPTRRMAWCTRPKPPRLATPALGRRPPSRPLPRHQGAPARRVCYGRTTPSSRRRASARDRGERRAPLAMLAPASSTTGGRWVDVRRDPRVLAPPCKAQRAGAS